MSGWKTDKKWSDRFISEIQHHLSGILNIHPMSVKIASESEDRERNTDLIILGINNIRIACRIRKNQYLSKYGNEFTIRSYRPSGKETEFSKIMNGWGDYIFYGFCNAEETGLENWFLGDLEIFRRWIAETQNYYVIKKTNFDGSSNFYSYNKNGIPGFIIDPMKFNQSKCSECRFYEYPPGFCHFNQEGFAVPVHIIRSCPAG